MILSVHIPKTAGTSFQQHLRMALGSRLLPDYEDSPEINTAEAEENRQSRLVTMISNVDKIANDYDAIHGHFFPGKYLGLFDVAHVITFIRDPYQHAISSYEHAMRTVESPHPGLKILQDNRMSLIDMVEAFPNHQSLYLRDVPLEEVSMVGLTERFEESEALFEVIFGIALPRETGRHNVNPIFQGVPYQVSDDLRRAVDKHRAEDLMLYRRAQEHLKLMLSKHDL